MSKKTQGVLSAVRRGRGGVRVSHSKNTAEMPVERMPIPSKVVISMQQHIGVPCTPLVKVGDMVQSVRKSVIQTSSFLHLFMQQFQVR